MITIGEHAAYVVGGYAGVAIAVAALIAWTAVMSYRARSRIAALERAGARRRSGGSAA